MINSPRVTTSNPGMVKGTIKHITVLVSIRDFRTLLDRVVPDMLLRRRQSGVKSTVIFSLIRYKGERRGDERDGKLGPAGTYLFWCIYAQNDWMLLAYEDFILEKNLGVLSTYELDDATSIRTPILWKCVGKLGLWGT